MRLSISKPGITVFFLFFCAFTLFWIKLPSRNYHPDGLDELQRIENENIIVSPKHFGSEAALQAMYKLLTKLGYRGKAIRPVQIWNGLWLTVFLFLSGLLVLKSGHSWKTALVWMLYFSGWYAVMHLALDPYLYYLPPSLALSAGAFCLVRSRFISSGQMWWWLLIILLGIVAFNPVLLITAPLIAWEWRIFQHPHKIEGKTPLPLLKAAGLIILPALLFAAVMLIFGRFELGRGPYGKLTALTLSLSWKGISGALTAAEQGQKNIFNALSGSGDPADWAVLVSHLLTPFIIISAGTCLYFMHRRIHFRRFLPWAATAAAAFSFVIWYDPPQVRFWIIPLWLTAMTWITASRRPLSRREKTTCFAALLLIFVQAVLLWAGNIASYAWPAAHTANRHAAFVEELKDTFVPGDTLLFPIYYDPYIEYFGEGLQSWSLVFLYRKKPDGFDTFDFLDRFIQRTQAKGGRVYMQMPPPGEPWVSEFIKQRFGVDYSNKDFQRLRFGETREVRGRIFRKLLFVTGDTN